MKAMIQGEDEYKKMRDSVAKLLKSAGKESDSKAAEMASADDGKKKVVCSALHELFDEALDLYETGYFTLEEMVDDFAKGAKALKE